MDINKAKKLYDLAKSKKNNEEVICPTCEDKFIKKFGKTFCTNGKKTAKNCKDDFWNKADEKKRNRKHKKSHYKKYNVGAKSFGARLGDSYAVSRGYHSYKEMKENELQMEGFDDGMGVSISRCPWCEMRSDVCRCD